MRRLAIYATAQASDPTGSTARVCGSDKAAQMAAYRFLGNSRVKASDIDHGPFQATARACKNRARLLCIQDTSSVSVCNSELREILKSRGSPTGFAVHSAVMVDGESGEYLGTISQQRWACKGEAKRFDGVCESEKWANADAEVSRRFPDMRNVVTVADREADILPFLTAKSERQERFVIRARHSRLVWKELPGLLGVARAAPTICTRKIIVEQRGSVPAQGIQESRKNRKRREVETTIQARSVKLVSLAGPTLTLNVVRVSAPAASESPDGQEEFEWILLTTEKIETPADVQQIVRDYEHRWIIEELHKVWKTGCRLEERPLQSLETLEKIMAITLPIAGRLLRLVTAARSAQVDHDVAAALTDNEARCLWASTEKSKYPESKPSGQWAILAIAKLGGWYDSKRTGRIGWQTFWHGWDVFSHRLNGWNQALGIREVGLV
jgi:hypothetical protein